MSDDGRMPGEEEGVRREERRGERGREEKTKDGQPRNFPNGKMSGGFWRTGNMTRVKCLMIYLGSFIFVVNLVVNECLINGGRLVQWNCVFVCGGILPRWLKSRVFFRSFLLGCLKFARHRLI